MLMITHELIFYLAIYRQIYPTWHYIYIYICVCVCVKYSRELKEVSSKTNFIQHLYIYTQGTAGEAGTSS